jgi:hypothetical protein
VFQLPHQMPVFKTSLIVVLRRRLLKIMTMLACWTTALQLPDHRMVAVLTILWINTTAVQLSRERGEWTNWA